MKPTSMSRHSSEDVRMRGFSQRTSVEDAIAWLDRQIGPLPEENVGLGHAAGRVLARNVSSPVDVPGFARAMMDGFALQANDSLGASAYNRLVLPIRGEALPGQPYPGNLVSGEAVRIMTGAPMPNGANAVLPAERTESEGDQVVLLGEVPPGKNVGRQGEDIASGNLVLTAGRLLRPQDVGALSSIGMAQVPVVRPPRVRIVVTGNELLPPGSRPKGYAISDANSPMLEALASRDGGVVSNPGIVPDEPQAIREALLADADVILVSGGTSVGQEDYVPQLVAELGELAIHGIAMRPSSPAGMGRLAERLVFLLPGNPVSCLCAYDFFAGRAIRGLGGQPKAWPYPPVVAPLRRKLVSAVGRVDYARIRFEEGQVEPLAISGASVLSSTTRADGFVVIPSDSEGYPAGTELTVYRYDVCLASEPGKVSF